MRSGSSTCRSSSCWSGLPIFVLFAQGQLSPEISTFAYYYIQFFFAPPALFTFFLAGFFVPRGAYLVGFIYGLIAGVIWSVGFVLAGPVAVTEGGSTPTAAPPDMVAVVADILPVRSPVRHARGGTRLLVSRVPARACRIAASSAALTRKSTSERSEPSSARRRASSPSSDPSVSPTEPSSRTRTRRSSRSCPLPLPCSGTQ